jgi:tetratricopeptide (TPR) repeat protein
MVARRLQVTDIFISYSRKDIAFARLLHDALKDNGFETWIDWQDIPPSTDWLKEVYTAIEEADTFIFILSSSSSDSEICTLEIEHARKNNKRLIPIVINDVEPSSVHPGLAAINWIFSRSKDEFQPAIADLITAIQTDFDWAKAHTRLQVRALEWERANNDKSFLLRGSDLSQAEEWFSKAAEKSPEPTLLQTQYLQVSRQEAVKRQRSLLLGVGAALIITVVLGVVAFINGQRATANAVSLSTQVVVAQNAEATAEQEAYFRATQQTIAEEQQQIAEEQRGIAVEQRGIAEEQTKIAIEQRNLAITRQLVSESLNLSENNYELALLLSLEASNLSPGSLFATGNILKVMLSNQRLLKFIHLETDTRRIAFRPDGKILASSGGPDEQSIILWDISSPDMIPLEISQIHTGNTNVNCLAFSPNGELLALGNSDSTIILWDVSTPESSLQPWRTSSRIRNSSQCYSMGCQHSCTSPSNWGIN